MSDIMRHKVRFDCHCLTKLESGIFLFLVVQLVCGDGASQQLRVEELSFYRVEVKRGQEGRRGEERLVVGELCFYRVEV